MNSIGGDAAGQSSFCRAWLCPSEFLPGRVYDLQRKSLGAEHDAATSEFKRALEQEPASAVRWAEVAEASPKPAESAFAAFCMKKAVEAGPHSAFILARAGNWFFERGDFASAQLYFRQVLANPEFDDYYPAVFLSFRRMRVSVPQMLGGIVPPRAAAAQAFLRFEMATEDAPSVRSVWVWLAAHGFCDSPIIHEYLAFLVAHGEAETAADLWASLEAREDREYRRNNWIFNGRFDFATDSEIFNWKIDSGADTIAKVVREGNGTGRPALQLEFSGDANTDFHGVHEAVVLHPGRWRFSVHMKSDGVTTDQGVGVRIFDPKDTSRLDARSEFLLGTNGWMEAEKIIDVGRSANVAQAEVFRDASAKFDNKISGKVWIDEIKLVPLR